MWVLDERYEAGITDDDQAQCMLECLERWGLAKPQTINRRGKWEVVRFRHNDNKGMPSMSGFHVIPIDYAATFRPESDTRTIAGPYPAEIYHARGLPVVRADKARKPGWSTVKRYLHQERIEKRKDGEDYAVPVLRIYLSPERQAQADGEKAQHGMGGPTKWAERYRHKGCPHLVRTLPTIDEDPRDPEDIDETPAEGPPPEDHPADTLRMGLHTRPRTATPPPPEAAKLPWQLESDNNDDYQQIR